MSDETLSIPIETPRTDLKKKVYMRGLLVFILLFFYTALISRYYYMNGINDAKFDREVANKRLVNCQRLITENK